MRSILKCIAEPYELYGDFNTLSSRNLMVVYEMCDPDKYKCKEEAEIQSELEHSYIVVLENII